MDISGSLLLKDATLLPMSADVALEHRDILVENGVIVRTAPANELRGEKELDCSGKYVIPSLWDMHVHLFNDEFADYTLSWGVTAVMNMWGFAKTLRWRDEIAGGRRVGPDIFTTGPIIDSRPTYPLITVAKTAQQASAAVRDTKNAGYDFVKIYNNLTAEAYAAVCETARELGIGVVGHLPNCVNSDYTGEHKKYTIDQLTVEHILFVNDDNLKQIARAGIYLDPTFTVEQVFRFGPSPAMSEAVKELRPGIVDLYWKALSGQHKKPRPDAQKTVRKPPEYYDDIFRRYLELGGKFLVGTDSGFPNVVPGFAMHEELLACVEHGTTNYEALRAATLGAAEFLGLDSERGSIAQGKQAQLLVLNADPIADINATRDIFALVNRRALYTAAELAAMRRRARRRSELAVDSVFRSYMLANAGKFVGELVHRGAAGKKQ